MGRLDVTVLPLNHEAQSRRDVLVESFRVCLNGVVFALLGDVYNTLGAGTGYGIFDLHPAAVQRAERGAGLLNVVAVVLRHAFELGVEGGSLRTEALERARNLRVVIFEFACALSKAFLPVGKRFHQIFCNGFVSGHLGTSHVSSGRPHVLPLLLSSRARTRSNRDARHQTNRVGLGQVGVQQRSMKEACMRILIMIAVFEIAIGTAVAVLSPTTFNERFVALALGVVIAASIVLIATLLTPDTEAVAAAQEKAVDEVGSRRARAA
jgi:hypothetical protein